jgi:hypothetical protein
MSHSEVDNASEFKIGSVRPKTPFAGIENFTARSGSGNIMRPLGPDKKAQCQETMGMKKNMYF